MCNFWCCSLAEKLAFELCCQNELVICSENREVDSVCWL